MKPTPKTRHIFLYNEMVDHINQKFGVYIDDFSGLHRVSRDTKAPDWFLEWTKNNHGIKDLDDLCNLQKNDNLKYRNLYKEYDQIKNEPPYQNFWHFILDDVFFGDLPNGSIHDINFVELIDDATEDWQRKILDMFIEEFGHETIEVEFSW